LATGEVPKDWRIANVVPLFKIGSKDNLGNYKPVSLMSGTVKLLEKILRNRISSHLELNGLVSDRQHGFVRGRSCLTNLIEFFEKMTKMIDEGKILVQDSLQVNVQVQPAVRKANAMLAFMLRGREYKSRDVLLRLYKALVRPHLEY